MPDSTSNMIFGSVQQDFRWVSGIMIDYTWTGRQWNISTTTERNANQYKT